MRDDEALGPAHRVEEGATVAHMARRAGTAYIDTVVIGASQAGLATGYQLKRRGVAHVILDENERIGAAWRSRWDSLRLFTPRRYSGLPGMPCPGPAWSFPGKDEIADYFEAYAARFELPVRAGVRVERLSTDGSRYLVESSGDRLWANNVVVATGACHHPRIPELAASLSADILQMHSSSYQRPSQMRDGAVLVVGAGNSGAEIAVELARTHQVWLSGRDTGEEPTTPGTLGDRLFTPFLWFMASRIIDVGNPIGRKVRDHFTRPPRGTPLGRIKRKDIADAGVERVGRATGTRDGLPELEDGQVLDVANVVWCTGFRPDFSWIDMPILDEFGYPVHTRGIIESQPGLYFMGLPFQRTLSSALVAGVGRDAATIAAHIERRSSALRERDRGAASLDLAAPAR